MSWRGERGEGREIERQWREYKEGVGGGRGSGEKIRRGEREREREEEQRVGGK